MHPFDPQTLCAALIACPSVTPHEGGALALLAKHLEKAGFICTRVDRGGVCNLFAHWQRGDAERCFGFNGHTDVVPVGKKDTWKFNPFCPTEKNGYLYGRGAVDMKSGVAAFVAAAIDFVCKTSLKGDIVIIITGDEEGIAEHGTLALLDWMQAHGKNMDICLVGEPTCPNLFGETIKIGRRGSMVAHFTAHGVQGHSAYPHRANNPLPALLALMQNLMEHELDQGSQYFDSSTLVVTTVDTGNSTPNIIPATAYSTVNIRFNDRHSSATLNTWLHDESATIAQRTGIAIDVDIKVSGESFITDNPKFFNLIAGAVQAETGHLPRASTSGGTSDARFIRAYCPVLEFGLVGKTMHAVDERVKITQIHRLKAVYLRILTNYFA